MLHMFQKCICYGKRYSKKCQYFDPDLEMSRTVGHLKHSTTTCEKLKAMQENRPNELTLYRSVSIY